ncbi:MAG: hypothetical protein Q7T70_01545 [Polaromonas sp.]|nr:hypothetical protein [Polaromonas sp.]
MTLQQQLSALGAALQEVRDGKLAVVAFSRLASSQAALLDTLPSKFAPVLQQLLDRLESSALFSEESCSFSQTELLDSLQQWLEHAQRHLDKGAQP